MANSLNDGLGKPDQLDTAGIGEGEVASGAILSAHVSGGQVIARHQGFVGTGSPTVFGNSVQAGTFKTGAGSAAWVAFPTGFAAAPSVVVSIGPILGAASMNAVSTGTIGAGSFYVYSEAASLSGTYIAIGSGDI